MLKPRIQHPTTIIGHPTRYISVPLQSHVTTRRPATQFNLSPVISQSYIDLHLSTPPRHTASPTESMLTSPPHHPTPPEELLQSPSQAVSHLPCGQGSPAPVDSTLMGSPMPSPSYNEAMRKQVNDKTRSLLLFDDNELMFGD